MSDNKFVMLGFGFYLLVAIVSLTYSEKEKNKVCQPESIELMCDGDLSCVRDLHSACISLKR